ncbi:hypothetical protein [Nocardia bhagyanarayanae]|nr:hypothetical protein [Nocardia bhagyanarayanae]
MTGLPDSAAELFRRDPRPPNEIERRRSASYEAWRQLVVAGRIAHEQLVADLVGISRCVHSPDAYAFRYAIPEDLPNVSRNRLAAALRDTLARLPTESAGKIPLEEVAIRLVVFFGPVPMEWLSDSAIRAAFSGLRPRDVEFREYAYYPAALDKITVADPQRLSLLLYDVADAQLLCAARLAQPAHLTALHAVFGHTAGARAVFSYLACDFPPALDIPAPDNPRILAGLITLADGMPGDAVSHGLFPSPITKLARLCLASIGHYPPTAVLDAARGAYDVGRSYCAHDAVACALVHPEISVTERADLIRHLAAADPYGRAVRRWRARKKFWRIARRYSSIAC